MIWPFIESNTKSVSYPTTFKMFALIRAYLHFPKSDVSNTENSKVVSKWHEQYALEEDTFTIILDVQHFKPDELSVKVVGGGTITVEGKHEENKDEQGYILRHFIRTYDLSHNYDLKKIKSTLTSDGVLIVTVPQSENWKSSTDNQIIPISKTDKPFKQMNNHNIKHKL